MNTLLRNANVVDVRTGDVRRGVDIEIADGRIAAIGEGGSAAASSAGVDLAGAYVVPGYNDMHAHTLQLDDPSGAYRLMLAHGVTGYRQMAGSPQLLARRAAGGFPDTDDAPALLLLPGDLLTPLNAASPEAVREEVRRQHAQGADFVKMAFIAGSVYPAAQEEANRVGIPLGGHLPGPIPAEEASRLGIGFIEHLGPGLGLLSSCNHDHAAMHEQLAAEKPMRLPRFPGAGKLFAKLIPRIVVNPSLRTSAETVAMMRRAVETFDEDRVRALAAVLAENGTWQCATLVRVRASQLSDEPAWAENPALRYMSEATLKFWDRTLERYRRLPASTREVFRELYAAQLRLVRLLDEGGVPMIAGSDVTGAIWLVPGESLHREFDELAGAGIPPLRVLQMTTLDAARFAGADDLGLVEPGCRADLVVLDADPTADVSALHRVSGVVRAGRYRDRAELDRMLEGVAAERSGG